MKTLEVKPNKTFELELSNIATDKSISHRCAIFSLLSDEPSIVYNYLEAEDTLNSLEIAKSLGAEVLKEGTKLTIIPPKKIKEPENILDCGNAGTAIRLYTGFLSSQDGFFILTGDKYLRKRPMKRVVEPLKSIGAQIDGRDNGNLAPLAIRGKRLKGFNYESKIASAQVKSALILAALRASDVSIFKEPEKSRDHTENMLLGMGANLKIEHNSILIEPIISPLKPLNISVPSDPSSGFFFAVAAAINPGSKVVLKNMLLNQTRIEAYKILQKMGAEVEFIQKESKYEIIGDIVVRGRELKEIEVSQNISWLIDEIPALSIAMACADGKSIVKNAKELRVKESDRIKSIIAGLNNCGIKTNELEDGFEVFGGELKKGIINSFGDHRIAMSFAIAGLKCGMIIEDTECIATSFPNFEEILLQITELSWK